MSVAPPAEELEALALRIRQSLDASLLRPPYDTKWTPSNPTYGFCSIAAEAAWFVLGGKPNGWVAHTARDTDNSTHWWLEHDSGLRFDPTADQYRSQGLLPPYERGIKTNAGGFMGMRRDPENVWGMERKPSARALQLLERMRAVPSLSSAPNRPRQGHSI